MYNDASVQRGRPSFRSVRSESQRNSDGVWETELVKYRIKPRDVTEISGLRAGHNRLNYHLLNKLKIRDADGCSYGIGIIAKQYGGSCQHIQRKDSYVGIHPFHLRTNFITM